MCIIIQGNPKDIKKSILKNAFRNNPHGFGLMYLKNNTLIEEKILPKNFKQIKKLFQKHKNETEEIGLHFRFSTNGIKSKINSHPFSVLNPSHKYKMSLMHNSPNLPCVFIEFL